MSVRGINKVILIGYLGQDPEIRYMNNGNPITNISVATSVSWKDKKTNEFKEKTEWHRVVLFGKLAEISSNYLHKGSQVYIEGSLHTRKWKNQNGNDQYITEIIVGVSGVMYMLNNRYTEESKSVSNVIEKSDDLLINQHGNKLNQDKEEDPVLTFSENDIPF